MNNQKVTAGREALEDFAPKFAELNDDVLFGEIWSREKLLSSRDRSLITVTALMTSGMTDSSLQFHLRSAKKNGVTRLEIAEVLTHLAFYSGWPKAWAAFRLAKEIWREEGDAKQPEAIPLFPIGKPNTAYKDYFIGQSYLHMIATQGVSIANVTFEPGCRNHWHVHRAEEGGGQLLLCTNGRGWVQEWGKDARQLYTGDTVMIRAGIKHWHGAAKDSWFSHLAVEIPGKTVSNEWMEPVEATWYDRLE